MVKLCKLYRLYRAAKLACTLHMEAIGLRLDLQKGPLTRRKAQNVWEEHRDIVEHRKVHSSWHKGFPKPQSLNCDRLWVHRA